MANKRIDIPVVINGKVITGPACKEISINNKEKD